MAGTNDNISEAASFCRGKSQKNVTLKPVLGADMMVVTKPNRQQRRAADALRRNARQVIPNNTNGNR